MEERRGEWWPRVSPNFRKSDVWSAHASSCSPCIIQPLVECDKTRHDTSSPKPSSVSLSESLAMAWWHHCRTSGPFVEKVANPPTLIWTLQDQLAKWEPDWPTLHFSPLQPVGEHGSITCYCLDLPKPLIGKKILHYCKIIAKILCKNKKNKGQKYGTIAKLLEKYCAKK